jgi:hypothetical protein
MNTPGSANCACPAPTWSANLLTDGDFAQFNVDLNTVWFASSPPNSTVTVGTGLSRWAVHLPLPSPHAQSGVSQKVTLNPNVNYILSAFARSKDTPGTDSQEAIGLGDNAGSKLPYTVASTSENAWTKLTLPISGVGGSLLVQFSSMAGTAISWAEFADVSLVEQTSPMCQ